MHTSDTPKTRARPTAGIVSPRNRNKSPYGDPKRGKILLITIFCALRFIDLLIYFGTPATDKSRVLAALLVGSIWTTALLGAIWNRQDWARYAAVLLMLAGIVSYMILVPDIFERARTSKNLPLILVVSTVTNLAVAWCLVSSKHIRRLTSRSRE